ncbi:MAG: tetratricopeptide repeat protein [Alphaproteobacteria bacterium]|nr:tetratricopeptide repeat protein [Alphaproteobacteria bacterium]
MAANATQRKLEAAQVHHRAGRLRDAEKLYRSVLRQFPRQDEAWHLLGLLRHQLGDSPDAARLIEEALKVQPGVAVYYENLSAIQRSRGDLVAVVVICERGLQHIDSPRLRSELVEAFIGLGRFPQALGALDQMDRLSPPSDARLADRALCLLQLGQLDAAASAAEQAASRNATNGNALSVLAEVATRRGQHAQAVAHWRHALRVQPDWPAARLNLALALLRQGDARAAMDAFEAVELRNDQSLAAAALNGQAAAHLKLGRPAKAVQSLRRGLAIAPDATESWSNLSEVRRATASAEALRYADRSLALALSNAGARSNRALALAECGDLPGAVSALRRAIALSPADPTFINNVNEPLRWLGANEAAIVLYRRALAIDPGHAAARYGLGTAQLATGDFSAGWEGYESRFTGDPTFSVRPFRHPQWDGGSLAGTVLIWGEQGLGDEIIYGSMLPEIERSGTAAIVECDRRMVGIFARSMPALAFVARSDPPDPRLSSADVVAQSAMASLAGRHRRRLLDFPAKGGYLRPRPDLADRWRRRLTALGPGLKVGFAWRSRRSDALARRFHPPIGDWAPMLARRSATFVSLQYGEFEDDLRSVEGACGAKVHVFADLDLLDDLENVLALSSVLDLVISTGTTAFCLPAAADTPVWLCTSSTDFFMFGTDRYPWFPSVRVFPHPYGQPWSTTIGRVADSLAELVRIRHGDRAQSE